MKTKKFNKKLALSKKTISNLNSDLMNVVVGGTEFPTFDYGYTCPGGDTCEPECPPGP
jgi:hypothetical protein